MMAKDDVWERQGPSFVASLRSELEQEEGPQASSMV